MTTRRPVHNIADQIRLAQARRLWLIQEIAWATREYGLLSPEVRRHDEELGAVEFFLCEFGTV